MAFRARELREGTSPDEVRRELNAIQRELQAELAALRSQSPVTSLITESTFTASYGQIVRVAPPSGGLRLILPPVNIAVPNGRVVAIVEAATGALSVEAIDTTINGSTTLAYLAGIGTVEFLLTPTGWYAWSSSLVTVALTSLANQADDTFLANIAGSSAPPTAVALTTLAGAGLTGGADAILAVGAGTGITVNANDVALANMAEARVKLRAVGAGTGSPIDGTGEQLGQILRFNSAADDATSTGTVVTYTIAETTNIVRFRAGLGALTLRGATIPAENGKIVLWDNEDSGVNVTFNHNDGSAATSQNRFFCPLNANLVIANGTRVFSVYYASRHRFIR